MVTAKKNTIGILAACLFVSSAVSAQKSVRPYKGGFVTKDSVELNWNYKKIYQYLHVRKGETVASVGAMNGYVEAQIATFVDSVNWTLQDIDTAQLNSRNFNNVLKYHEKLKGSPIIGNFLLVKGDHNQTNLDKDHFDRILLINVFHELSDKVSILKDIAESLKTNGELIVMERMGTKKGQKHGDCKQAKLWEPDFIEEMKGYDFKIIKKEIPDKNMSVTFYTFNKI